MNIGIGTFDRELLRLVYAFHGSGIVLYVLITCLIAGILASIIGLERQLQGEAAGIRTHALLAVGSSMLMTISIWAIRTADGSMDIAAQTITGDLNYDTSRIAAGVVTGIGFLAGGVIIRDKFQVRGLATAATLWLSTTIGLACGSGFVLEAIIAAAVVLIILLLFGRILNFIDNKSPSVTVCADADYPLIEKIREFSETNGYILKNTEVIEINESKITLRVSFVFTTSEQMLHYLRHHMLKVPEIEEIVINKNYISFLNKIKTVR